MNDNVDLMVEEARNNILKAIQNSGLTPSVTFYLLKDVYNSIEKDYFNYITSLQLGQDKQSIKDISGATTENFSHLTKQNNDDQEEN